MYKGNKRQFNDVLLKWFSNILLYDKACLTYPFGKRMKTCRIHRVDKRSDRSIGLKRPITISANASHVISVLLRCSVST